jgi:hypothetical protein
MLLLTAGLLYMGVAFGFYLYLIRTAQILPDDLTESTTPARCEPAPVSQKQAA